MSQRAATRNQCRVSLATAISLWNEASHQDTLENESLTDSKIYFSKCPLYETMTAAADNGH